MDSPKISVLVPLYNRRHYIEQCLNSALNQTFREDYEIIVRDDGSTDGSADFVEQRYAAEISSGKLKLRRNEKNIGEFPTDNRLLREAAGKYIMILHSDDLYLPHALEHMYEVAELSKADVVHESFFFTTAPDGVVKNEKSLILKPYDKQPVDKITIMPNDLLWRFNEWYSKSIGIDAQHNIFSRKFLMENDLRFEPYGGNGLLAFIWIMKAKVLVKTPIPFYVYRNSPDSGTNAKCTPEYVANFISEQINLSRRLDEIFSTEDFFKNNEEFQYLARSHIFYGKNNYWLKRPGAYKDGVTPELNRAVEEAFKKYFGEDAAFPAFLFNWIHSAMFGKPVDVLTPPQST